jgi:hypothetical protein
MGGYTLTLQGGTFRVLPAKWFELTYLGHRRCCYPPLHELHIISEVQICKAAAERWVNM